MVLISIDTLRSDRLPIYGYERGSTPAIDALRRDGILAARAYTHVPLTLPAHASLFTGLLPPGHGVRDNSGYRLRENGVASLAPLVKAAGYATGAAVSAYVLRAETGLASGFDLYEDAIDLGSGASLADQQRAGIESLRASLPWLREAAAQGPFLYWLHLYEPHTPYSPPEPYRSRFASPYDGEIAAADAAVGELVRRCASSRSTTAAWWSFSPTTAKASAITARTSTAPCSIARRCRSRCCSSCPAASAPARSWSARRSWSTSYPRSST